MTRPLFKTYPWPNQKKPPKPISHIVGQLTRDNRDPFITIEIDAHTVTATIDLTDDDGRDLHGTATSRYTGNNRTGRLGGHAVDALIRWAIDDAYGLNPRIGAQHVRPYKDRPDDSAAKAAAYRKATHH